jgi:hypothetical protein
MRRLPLTKMCSRETNRLPVEQIQGFLQTASDLPLEITGIPEPSKKYFVYHFDPMELDLEVYKHQFLLVEVDGNYERIITQGDATGVTFNFGSRYISFHAFVKGIGNYAFYCPFFENKIFGK